MQQAVEDQCGKLIGEIMFVGTFIITMTLSTGTQGMSMNMIKGVNAIRCAFLNGFDNFYLLLTAAVFALIQFDQLSLLQEQLDEYYPYICTCKEDVKGLG